MRKSFAAATILGLTLAGMCLGQQSDPGLGRAVEGAVQPPPTAIPTMVAPWDPSQQYDRYHSPQEARRRVAEWKAEQRRQRIEAAKWMGYSPLRPPASPLPFMGSQVGWVGVGIYYPIPGAFHQPGLPTFVLGRAEHMPGR